MNIARKIFVGIAAGLLPVALLSFGLLISFNHTFGTPEKLKQALEKSNVYEAAVASLVHQQSSDAEQGSQSQEGIPSSQKEIQDAVTAALPSDTLKGQTSQILDGVYAWLQGDTQGIEFQVDLTNIRDTLATNLSEQAKTQATQLPPCGSDTTVSSQDFDPFGANCLPTGLAPDAVAGKTKQDILGSELFKDPTLNASDLKGKDGKPLQEQLQPLSDVYRAVRSATVVSGIALIALIAALVFLSSPWRLGIRRLGIILLSIGGITILLAVLEGVLSRILVDAVTRSSGDDAIQTALAKTVRYLADDMRDWWLGYGILLAAAGAGVLICLALIKKSQSAPSPKPAGTASTPVQSRRKS
jgi:hypothetical protein